ncbi:hypothetical protein DFQ28_007178 [Apophysomyces sp. BC1034]|nr:hypothetical protein DFQ30_008957 [Apophysomyces sp. BC1015]KAG0177063.1 hypothetical protein DFQ29_005303 [Apophysomyces sp. BC1021]KAG0186884.1 hypothetical protein DFQ28_007178 [Apophysomyces sp. BC1034]
MTHVDNDVTRHLCLSNIPLDVNLRRLPLHILQGLGDIKLTYANFLDSHGLLTVTFYDLRHAQHCYNTLTKLIQQASYSTLRVTYVTETTIATLYHQPVQKCAGSLFVSLNGTSDRLEGFNYKGFLETFGSIYTSTNLEYSGIRLVVLVEFYDERVAKEVCINLHTKIFQGITFDIRPYTEKEIQVIPSSWPKGFNSRLFPTTTPGNAFGLQRLWSEEQGLQSSLTPHCQMAVDNTPCALVPSGLVGQLSTSAMAVPTSVLSPSPSPFPRKHTAGYTHALNPRQRYFQSNPSSSSQSLFSRDTWSSDSLTSPTSSIKKETPGQPLESSSHHAKTEQSECSEPAITLSGCKPENSGHSVDQDNTFDTHRVAQGLDIRTTFMIRNIPNKYTQQMLIECIDATHKGCYDFLYLRIDFKNRCNVGYAFINFIDPKDVISFANERVGKRWNRFNSEKRCSLSYANIQGKEALIDKFRNSNVMEEEEGYRPKIFYSHGANKGVEEPFPQPTLQITTRRHRQQDKHRHDAAGEEEFAVDLPLHRLF